MLHSSKTGGAWQKSHSSAQPFRKCAINTCSSNLAHPCWHPQSHCLIKSKNTFTCMCMYVPLIDLLIINTQTHTKQDYFLLMLWQFNWLSAHAALLFAPYFISSFHSMRTQMENRQVSYLFLPLPEALTERQHGALHFVPDRYTLALFQGGRDTQSEFTDRTACVCEEGALASEPLRAHRLSEYNQLCSTNAALKDPLSCLFLTFCASTLSKLWSGSLHMQPTQGGCNIKYPHEDQTSISWWKVVFWATPPVIVCK